MSEPTRELCEHMFFDMKVLLKQPQTVYRIDNYASGRYYFTMNTENEPTFYISVTNMIGSTLPTSPHLIKWIADMGYEESQDFKNERANYGTFLHMKIGELLINRQLNFDLMKIQLLGYCEEQKIDPAKADEWLFEMQKDCLAFVQFMNDYQVKPIAIEMVLAHPDGYAGAIDLLCDMTVEQKGFFGEVYKSGPRKGQPKETKKEIKCRAFVDFKSGRKGFFEAHEIQLESYKRMGKHHFPHLFNEGQPPIKLFNWAPKEWKSSPSYSLKDQTYSTNLEKFDNLVSIGNIEAKKRKRTKLVISGTINVDDVMSGKEFIEKNFQYKNIEDLIMEN